MSDTEQPRKPRSLEELRADVEQAAHDLASSDYSARGAAWEFRIQPSGNVLWQLADASCGLGQKPGDADACLRVVGQFKDNKTIQQFVEKEHGPQAYQRLLAQVSIIETAAAIVRSPDGTDSRNYRAEARAAVLAAGSPFGDPATCDSVITLAIDRLHGGVAGRSQRAETHLLLVGAKDKNADVCARLVMELLPGDEVAPVPDPLLGSIVQVDKDIVDFMCSAWEEAKKRRQQAGRAVWWIESPKKLVSIDGDSAQTSIFAVTRSLLEGVPIDASVAISATIRLCDPDQPLGDVGAGDQKWKLAQKPPIHTLLLHPDTAAKARQGLGAGPHAELATLKEVNTFEEAWNELTGEARLLGDYRDDVEQKWLSQWSRIIDGDKVSDIVQNEATGKLKVMPPRPRPE